MASRLRDFFATLLRSSSYEGQARDHKEKAFETGVFFAFYVILCGCTSMGIIYKASNAG
jgi:hypothetical protein